MIEYELNRQPASTATEKRVTNRKGRLSIDLPVNSFQAAFLNFNKAAEAFAMSLSDPLHRKFAFQYLEYLQDIARGSERSKLSTSGRPNCRLISAELERLFRCHFFRPDHLKPIQN
jgi:hypothetical protein